MKFDFKGKFKVNTLKQRPIYMTSGHFHGQKLSENVCIELSINLSQKGKKSKHFFSTISLLMYHLKIWAPVGRINTPES